LADAGQSVVVFDKGRGLGGRMASRRKDGWRFDHGAVALRATDDAFAAFLATAHDMGHAEVWNGANGWTGVPGMRAMVKSLDRGPEIVLSQRVTVLDKTDGGWIVQGPQNAENLIFAKARRDIQNFCCGDWRIGKSSKHFNVCLSDLPILVH
jgi:renalase